MADFQLGRDWGENVKSLLKALGSVKRPLSYDDLAAMLNDRDPGGRKRNASTIQRWSQKKGAPPDPMSLKLMADLAGVSMEAFTFGPTVAAPSARKSDGELRSSVLRRVLKGEKASAWLQRLREDLERRYQGDPDEGKAEDVLQSMIRSIELAYSVGGRDQDWTEDQAIQAIETVRSLYYRDHGFEE